MKKTGFSLVEIMIAVAIIALLAAVAVPGLLRARIVANESATQATLKSIAKAYELYAAENGGAYPTDETDLTSGTNPYLSRTYDGAVLEGFTYTVTPGSAGYSIKAMGNPGKTSSVQGYLITTGAVMSTID